MPSFESSNHLIPGKLYCVSLPIHLYGKNTIDALPLNFSKAATYMDLDHWKPAGSIGLDCPVMYIGPIYKAREDNKVKHFIRGHKILMFDGTVRWVDYGVNFVEVDYERFRKTT